MAELGPAEEMKDSGIDIIGEIPKHWTIRKIKYGFNVGSGATPKSDVLEFWDGDIVWVTPADYKTEDVYISKSRKNLTQMGYNSCGTTIVPAGSLIFSKRAPVGTVGITTIPLCTNQGCLTCIPNNTVSNTYFYYVMSVSTEQFEVYSSGTLFKEISAHAFENIMLPFPPLSEQQAIADYLDGRCSKIDEIIAEATASIEEYKELKQAVIFDAVTKGLKKKTYDNNSLDWCESGICSDWDISQIRYLYRLRNERNEKPLEEVNLISLYTDKGVVQHADLEKTTGNKAVTADGYKLVYPEDIIVNIILCWMGAMGRCEYHGVTSPAYDIYEPIDNKRVCSRYYHYLFRTDAFSGKCYTLGRGIMMMRWRTYSSEFRSIKVPVPPMDEQESIANYLDKRVSDIDTLITEKQSLIDDLQAYKKSLIYEVVTGKRRVV